MKTTVAAAVAALLATHAADARHDSPARDISLKHLASISTGSVGATGAEIVAYDAKTKRAFAINSTDNNLVVLDLADPAAPILYETISLAAYGAGLNSVDAHRGLVAVAVEASPKTNPGRVVFVDAATLEFVGDVGVGALPDMVTFDGDGEHLLVANEGEPNSYNQADSVNPEGSISIIDLEQGVANASVRTADFKAFSKAALTAKGVRVFGPNATAAQDLEPEYITVKGRTAWVTLQEANAVAILDVPTATVQDILPLGRKNHAELGNALDPSDRDGPGNTASIKIANWPVHGLYQPDAIAHFNVGRQRYLVTANEGDSRAIGDFLGFGEETQCRQFQLHAGPESLSECGCAQDQRGIGPPDGYQRLGRHGWRRRFRPHRSVRRALVLDLDHGRATGVGQRRPGRAFLRRPGEWLRHNLQCQPRSDNAPDNSQ